MRAIHFLLLSVFFFILSGFRTPGAELRVRIGHLRNEKGHVLVSLFRNGEGYPDEPEKAYRKGQALISNGNAVMVFHDLPAGDYAIAILHDENDDLRMNKNWLGLPTEGYGFSNNVMGMFGPPGLSKASFAVKATGIQYIDIRIKY